MAKVDILDIMKTKMKTPLEFRFDSLQIPPMYYFLTQQDVEALHYIATSVKLSSNIRLKYKMIDDIMKPRGFKRFSAGTNRVVYSYYEDTSFVVKIAVDKVGMQDNPAEYENQFLLQPYITKMFYISQCGTVGFAERVLPVKNKTEFREIAPDVFDILINKILGKYVVEDIGTKYFMNYGVRAGYGPVLLDYPYVYKLDGKKLFCTNILPDTGMLCDGEIDYDEGFNNLICTKCGKKYLACELRDESSDDKTINIKGGSTMKVVVKRGDKIIHETFSTDEVMRRRKEEELARSSSSSMKVKVVRGETVISSNCGVTNEAPIAKIVDPVPRMSVSVKNGNKTISSTTRGVNSTNTDNVPSVKVTDELNTTSTTEEIKSLLSENNLNLKKVIEEGAVVVELEVVHEDEDTTTSETSKEDSDFEAVNESAQNIIDDIVNSRDVNPDEDYSDEEDEYYDDEVEEEESSINKYEEEYDAEYGRVKVNKSSKFKSNKEKNYDKYNVKSKFVR